MLSQAESINSIQGPGVLLGLRGPTPGWGSTFSLVKTPNMEKARCNRNSALAPSVCPATAQPRQEGQWARAHRASQHECRPQLPRRDCIPPGASPGHQPTGLSGLTLCLNLGVSQLQSPLWDWTRTQVRPQGRRALPAHSCLSLALPGVCPRESPPRQASAPILRSARLHRPQCNAEHHLFSQPLLPVHYKGDVPGPRMERLRRSAWLC